MNLPSIILASSQIRHNMLLYHHCRCLESIVFGEVKDDPELSDPDFKSAYLWLAKEIGFYPLFLAVGQNDEDLRMTGYQNQFKKIIGSKIVGKRNNGTYIQKNILRQKGKFPNDVLFSFENANGVLMDYMNWHLVLNASYKNYNITGYERKLIFKPSWTKSEWLKKARNEPGSVQIVTEVLYLPDAKRIYVRNQQAKKSLIDMGFKDVEVKRVFE